MKPSNNVERRSGKERRCLDATIMAPDKRQNKDRRKNRPAFSYPQKQNLQTENRSCFNCKHLYLISCIHNEHEFMQKIAPSDNPPQLNKHDLKRIDELASVCVGFKAR